MSASRARERERKKKDGLDTNRESLPYGVEAGPIGLRAPKNSPLTSQSHYRLGLATGSQLTTGFDPQRTERLIRSLDVRKKRESERTQIIVSYGTRALRV